LRRAANTKETSYVLLFASMVGLLAGMELLVYDWPQSCIAYVPECPSSYAFVVFGILIVLASVGLMAYSIRNHVR